MKNKRLNQKEIDVLVSHGKTSYFYDSEDYHNFSVEPTMEGNVPHYGIFCDVPYLYGEMLRKKIATFTYSAEGKSLADLVMESLKRGTR